jgi:predicted SAM-dependent methyltransferase
MTIVQRIHHLLKNAPPLHAAAKWLLHAYRSTIGAMTFRRRVKQADMLRIIIGSGGMYGPGWIPSEIQFLNLLDDADWQKAFGKRLIDVLLAEHVWEHLTPADASQAAAQCFKYLKPGGYLRVAVPDGRHPDPEYIEWVRIGGSGPGASDHKVLYTAESFRNLFAGAGFDVELLEYYDTQGKFHRSDWDVAAGPILRRQGKTERKADGSTMNYTSIILDARKPVAPASSK